MAKILSLFNGMNCAHIALENAGVDVEALYSYEIDKYANAVSKHNFPNDIYLGDVFTADFTQYEGVDFVMGGSPCTYWSIAQKNNRETEASGMGWELFQQYVRAVREAKPKYFIYENNKSMSKQIRASIDEAFGFEAVFINSALVSAQNRQRLYWVGKRNADGTYSKVNVEQPEDRGILLRDVLESATAWQEKSYALTTRCMGAIPEDTLSKHRHTMVAEPVNVTEDGKARTIHAGYGKLETKKWHERVYNKNPNKQQHDYVAEPVCVNSKSGRGGVDGLQPSLCDRIYDINGKATAVTAVFHPKIAEPVCLCYKRTAEAKRCRKDHEAGRVHHGFHELSELHPREDGKTNTLSTVLKDNPICEPVRVGTIESIEPLRVKEATTKGYAEIEPGDCVDLTMPNSKTRRGRSMKDKCNCLMTGNQYYQYCGTIDKPIYEVRNGMITIKGKQYPIKLADGYYIIRKLTVRECMRLQTVPEWYDFSVISNSQAYKCLGNGWTCDVISHLIESALKEDNE